MKKRLLSLIKSRSVQSIAVLTMVLTMVVTALVFRHAWWPVLNAQIERLASRSGNIAEVNHDHTDHASDSQKDHGHSGNESLQLSAQAMKNLGLTAESLQPIRLSTFYRTISVPAMIVERPGRSVMQVSTPMTGVVTTIFAVMGAAVEPGDPLFRIRLTHEELVSTQTDFVRALGELDVENREIIRLQAGVDSGVLPPRTVLERQYAKEKLEALLSALREALRLHGLSERQVALIEKDRRLLSELSVTVPSAEITPSELQLSNSTSFQPVSLSISRSPLLRDTAQTSSSPLIIESLDVQKGQSIEQGGRLCALADYSRLYIEGRAFEQDADVIGLAASREWNVRAVFSNGISIADLPLVFVSSEIDTESRILKFYVDLSNEMIRDRKDAEGHRFVSWKYKPGQRLQLQIPVEEWKDQLVLPVDAVAQDGADSFVFQQNGNRFERVAVHVMYRDQTSVVIANDGALFPGDVVALRSAHQMQMAVRNQSGAAIDPHAGHNH